MKIFSFFRKTGVQLMATAAVVYLAASGFRILAMPGGDCDSGDCFDFLESEAMEEGGTCPIGESGEPEIASYIPLGPGGSDSCSSCNGGQQSFFGMPVWHVSQPHINLWIRDEPLGYQPGRGPRVAFRMSYKQRETVAGFQTNFFSAGKRWNLNWLSFVVPGASETADVYFGGGGKRNYALGYRDYLTNTKLEREENEGNLSAYRLVSPGGAASVYGFVVTNGDGSVLYAFLSEKLLPNGQRLRFEYEPYDTNAPVIRLRHVIDADNRTNTVSYVSSHPYSTNLIAQVTDAFGRTMSLGYDTNGLLTTVTDVLGLSSSFAYDEFNCITNLTTPLGATAFKITRPPDDVMNGRAIEVTQPDGGKHLFLYRNGLSGILPDSFTDETPDTTPFDNNFDNTAMYDRNSFHWNPKQHPLLSTNDPTYFVAGDYLKGTMRHWLKMAGSSLAGRTISLVRQPSPDGVTEGLKTWYDYEGKPYADTEGAFRSPLFVGRVLPGGQSQFSRNLFDDGWGRVIESIGVYSVGSSVALRTNTYGYAENGQDLVWHIDAAGHLAVSNYFAEGNLFHQPDATYDALGQETRYTYNENGQVTSIHRPGGLTTTNIYYADGDHPGWLQHTIDLEIGRANSYTYANGLVATHTDERGVPIINTWDALHQLRRVDYPDGTFITNTYVNLNLTRTVDRMGFATSYGYDAMRRRIAMTNALGHFTLYNYCACGSLDSIRDAAGNHTYFFYDNKGRTIRTLYADGFSVTNRYNALGQLTNVVDSAGRSTTNWFNVQGLQCAVSNAFGRVSTVVFDIEDRAVNSVDANGVSVDMTYDELGRLLTRTYPDAGVERFGYSARGMIAYTNQLDKITLYGYDEAGRKIAETNANLEITQFGYDTSGNLTNLIDGKGQNTWWVYDEYSRVTNKVDHLENLLFLYQYDPNNRLTNRWSAAKGATVYRYDPVHNLTNVDYAASADLTLKYDALKRLTNMVDGVGTTKYGYNAAGQLLSEDGPWDEDTVSYSYNHRQRGGLSLLQPGAGAWGVTYGYDAAGRLDSVVSPAGTFDYDYHPVRHYQINKLTLPGSAYITNTFDSVGRLLATRLNNSAHAQLNLHSYDYNAGNQRTKQTRTDGSFVDYGYDSIGQLTGAAGKEAGGTTNRAHEQFGYLYDAAGNLNYRTNSALIQTFNVDSLNQLSTINRSGTLTVAGTTTILATNVTVNGLPAIRYSDKTFARTNVTLADGNNTFTAIGRDLSGRADTNVVTAWLPATATYEYDLNGNMLSDGRRGFEYSDENQLIRITESGAWKAEFTYDGLLRRRVCKEFTWNGSWVQTNEIRYVWDGDVIIQERDFNNLPAVTYTRGNDASGTMDGHGGIGGLLARTDSHSIHSHAYYHADGNGNITALINTNQLQVARYLYDPFGNIVSLNGPLAEANTYGFSSMENYRKAAIILYLYRPYSPHLQRWLNKDPAEDANLFGHLVARSDPSAVELNPFVFVSNDPVTGVDPFGFERNPPVLTKPPKIPWWKKILPPWGPVDASVITTTPSVSYKCKNKDLTFKVTADPSNKGGTFEVIYKF